MELAGTIEVILFKMSEVYIVVRIKRAFYWYLVTAQVVYFLYFVLLAFSVFAFNIIIIIVTLIVFVLLTMVIKKYFKEIYEVEKNRIIIRRKFLFSDLEIVNFKFQNVTIEHNLTILLAKQKKISISLNEKSDDHIVTVYDNMNKVIFKSENLDFESFEVLQKYFFKLSGKTE